MAYWNPPGQSRFPQIYIPYQNGRTNASPDYFETLSWEQTPNEELRSYYDNELFNRFMYYEPMQNQNIDLQNSMNEFKGLQFFGNRNPLTTQPRSYDINFNSTSDSGPSFGSTSGGSGMSKDPRNYIEAAKDIATWTADIVDSSRSKMGLPALRQYHPETIRDVESYGMMKRGPLLGRSLADVDKPRFGSSFLDVNKKSIKGAMDGWNISNNWIGAVVGGVIGAGMGVGNALTKLKTYNENLRRLTRQDKMQTQNFLAGQNTGYRNIRSNVKSSMNRQRLSSNYALGGQIDNEEIMGITKYGAGGTHEENPNGGVQVGIGDNGRPNLVEEGEVRWNDFIFSQRVKPTEEVLRKYNTFMRGDYTSYAELADKILKLHEGRENSPFDRASLQVQMQRLADAQEFQKSIEQQAPQEQMIMPQQQYATGGYMGTSDANYYALGGGDDDKYYVIHGRDQVRSNQPVQIGNYKTIAIKSDEPGNPLCGPTKTSSKIAFSNDRKMIWSIRKFAGSWQRFNEAARNFQTQLQQNKEFQNSVLNTIGDINNLDAEDIEYLYAKANSEDNNLKTTINNYINAYCELDRSLLAVQNIFAWAEVYDKNFYNDSAKTGLDDKYNKTYQFTRYLFEIGHFAPNDPIQDWNGNYIVSHIIKGDPDYKKCIDAMNTYANEYPQYFKLHSQDGGVTNTMHYFDLTNQNLYRRKTAQPSDFANTDFSTGGFPTPTSTFSSTNAPSNSASVNQSQQRIPQNNTRTTSGVNSAVNVATSIRPPRYYDMATGKYVENDPTNPNILTITGGGSSGTKPFDGTIVYNAANNNNYYDKYNSLSDEDFENILSNLKSKYPGRYDSYTINDVKRGGGDNKFGNIHKEIGLYQKPIAEQQQVPETQETVSNAESVENVADGSNSTNRFGDVEMDLDENTNQADKDWRQYIYRGMMAAPVLDNIRSILTQDPPDYTYANQLASLYRPVTYRPTGRYQRFMPSDTHYLDTQARQSTNTLLGHYKNNPISSSASDYFATLASTVGGTNAARQYLTALRQNNAERNATTAVNNQVDAANENARRSTLGSNIQNYANIMAQSYAAAEQERLAVENAIENNYMNLATNIGELGHEWYDRWRVDKTPYYSYDSNLDYNGRLVYVPQSYPQSNGKRKSKD